jgi:thiamine-phosphate pyrophosphorylase
VNRSRDLADRLSLIVLTDEAQARDGELLEVVRAALRGGAPAVQVRSKHATGRHMVELTRALLTETHAAGALLFVNDRVDVALAAGADGAHLGDDDLPLPAARRVVPPGFILGRSVETPEQAKVAEREGADYLGAGPVFATESKPDAGEPIGLVSLGRIADAVRIPVVAIGGIELGNAREVRQAGAVGIAVIRAVMQVEEPEEEVRRLLRELAAGAAG